MHQAERAKFKKFNANNYRIGIVLAQFNSDIIEALLEDALKMAEVYKIPNQKIKIFRVAGCVEIPVISQSLAKTKQYNCLLALGAIIRGETPHFDYVAKIVSEGINRIMLDFQIPIGFGVLTTNNLQQAKKRIDVGGAALEAALQNAKLLENINRACC